MFDDTDLRTSYTLLTSVRSDLAAALCCRVHIYGMRCLSTAKFSPPCAHLLLQGNWVRQQVSSQALFSSAAGKG